ALVIREQQLPRETARESPDGGLLGEACEEPRGGLVADAAPAPHAAVVLLVAGRRGPRRSPPAARSPTSRGRRHRSRAASGSGRGVGWPAASARGAFPRRQGRAGCPSPPAAQRNPRARTSAR